MDTRIDVELLEPVCWDFPVWIAASSAPHEDGFRMRASHVDLGPSLAPLLWISIGFLALVSLGCAQLGIRRSFQRRGMLEAP